MVARGVGLGGAEALGEADEHDADAGGGEVTVGAAGDVGQPELRSPLAIEPTIATP